jgi:AraC family carnitine catabolism transcriptional activator
MSITAICVACGFESPSHFSRTYRARFGTSPRSDRSPLRHTAGGNTNTTLETAVP